MAVFFCYADQFSLLLSLRIAIMIVVFANAIKVDSAEISNQNPQVAKNQFNYYSDSFEHHPSPSFNQNPIFENKFGIADNHFQHGMENKSPPSFYEFRYPIHDSFQESESSAKAQNKLRRQEESGKETQASTHAESEATKTEENLSPFEQAFEKLTTPEQLIPIINDLTFITLILLHLPAIIPTILIPLAFFGVGALLIPFVRVNYFINHKDNDEDGRQLTMSGLEYILSSIYEKIW